MNEVDNGGGYACMGMVGVYGETLSFSQNCCKPKTGLKKVIKKTHIKQQQENDF